MQQETVSTFSGCLHILHRLLRLAWPHYSFGCRLATIQRQSGAGEAHEPSARMIKRQAEYAVVCGSILQSHGRLHISSGHQTDNKSTLRCPPPLLF